MTGLTKKDAKQLATVRDYLSHPAVRANVQELLPKHLSADRMAKLVLSCARRTPDLLKCTPESLADAMMRCSELGLEPNGRDVHLIPFRNNKAGTHEVQVITDYKGLIKLAYQSGQVIAVFAKAVRANDHFDYRLGTENFIEHRPADVPDRGPLTHAWASAKLKAGGEPFVVLNASEIAQHQKTAKGMSRSDSPWTAHPDSMWAKTALRELSKFIPLSPQLERAVEFDTPANPVIEADFTAIEDPDPPQSKSQRIAKQAKKAKAKPLADSLAKTYAEAITTAPGAEALERITADIQSHMDHDALTSGEGSTLHGLIEVRQQDLSSAGIGS